MAVQYLERNVVETGQESLGTVYGRRLQFYFSRFGFVVSHQFRFSDRERPEQSVMNAETECEKSDESEQATLEFGSHVWT